MSSKGLLPLRRGVLTGAAAAACLTLAPASESTGPDATVRVSWCGQTFDPSSAPASLSSRQHEALSNIWDWAVQYEYRLDFDKRGRVLLLSPVSERGVNQEFEWVESTLRVFDSSFSKPALKDLDLAGSDARRRGGERVSTLVRLENQEDYNSLLEHVAANDPSLTQWAWRSRVTTGFSIDEPLLGAWIDERGALADGQWREQNELTNRLAQTLICERFDRLPHWLAQGMAWHVELESTGSVYSYPNREGFKGLDEHRGWANRLSDEFRTNREILPLHELTGWHGPDFDESSAALAWGVVNYLERYRGDAASILAADLGAYSRHHGRVTAEDGTDAWREDWQVPFEVQMRALLHAGGPDVLEDVTECYRKGSRFRPKTVR